MCPRGQIDRDQFERKYHIITFNLFLIVINFGLVVYHIHGLNFYALVIFL
jgi:hypothetical protein